MTVRISTQSLGAVTPYVIVGSLVLSPAPQTGATRPSIAETAFRVPVERVYIQSETTADQVDYNLDLDRPDLIPLVIVLPAPSYELDYYEPFIISEGWREEASIEGSFLVEEDLPPVVIFDDYDRATIDLHE
jgi:hypothetical protein